MGRTQTVTLAQIAAEFKLSKTAISRALRDMPDIGVETRRKVQAYAKDKEYVVNWAARSLVTNRSGLIGIGMGSFTNPFFQEVTYALVRQIKARGFSTVMIDIEPLLSDTAGLASLQAKFVDGLILLEGWYNARLAAKDVLKLDAELAPTIYRGNLPSEEVDQVVVDWYDAAFSLTNHLVDLGHQHIAVLRGIGGGGPVYADDVSGKLQGTIDALRQRGLGLKEEMVRYLPTTLDNACQVTASLLTQSPRPTAIVCHTDYLAIGAMRAVIERGFSVPDDVSIVGFNDIEVGKYLPTSLTTIAHDRDLLAEELVERLISRIEGRLAEQVKTNALHQILIRESSGPPPGRPNPPNLSAHPL